MKIGREEIRVMWDRENKKQMETVVAWLTVWEGRDEEAVESFIKDTTEEEMGLARLVIGLTQLSSSLLSILGDFMGLTPKQMLQRMGLTSEMMDQMGMFK